MCPEAGGVCSKAKTKICSSKLVTSKEQILHEYSDVFEGIVSFPGPPYHIQIDQSVSPKQTPCHPIPVHLKEAFKQEVVKMLQAGVLKPVMKLHLGLIVLCLLDKQGQVQ